MNTDWWSMKNSSQFRLRGNDVFQKGKVSFSYVITKKKNYVHSVSCEQSHVSVSKKERYQSKSIDAFYCHKKGRYWARLFQHNQQRQHTWRISHAKATSSEDMEHVNMKFRGFVWFSVRDRNSNKIRCGPKVRHWFYVLQIISLKWLWTLVRVKHINYDVCLMHIHVSPQYFWKTGAKLHDVCALFTDGYSWRLCISCSFL